MTVTGDTIMNMYVVSVLMEVYCGGNIKKTGKHINKIIVSSYKHIKEKKYESEIGNNWS